MLLLCKVHTSQSWPRQSSMKCPLLLHSSLSSLHIIDIHRLSVVALSYIIRYERPPIGCACREHWVKGGVFMGWNFDLRSDEGPAAYHSIMPGCHEWFMRVAWPLTWQRGPMIANSALSALLHCDGGSWLEIRARVNWAARLLVVILEVVLQILCHWFLNTDFPLGVTGSRPTSHKGKMNCSATCHFSGAGRWMSALLCFTNPPISDNLW